MHTRAGRQIMAGSQKGSLLKPNPIEIDSLDARRTRERKRMVIDRNPASYATYPKCLETDQ
jgi:hypothetical protein